MPYAQSLNLVVLLNGIGIPARIIPGYLSDTYFGILNTFSFFLLLTAVSLWCWLAVDSIPAYYAFITVYGLMAASFQASLPRARDSNPFRSARS